MTRHYQLKVTSPTTNIDVDSVDAQEVARIVQLAGLPPTVPAPPDMSVPATMPPMPASPDMSVSPDMSASPDMDANADLSPVSEQTCSICGSTEHDEMHCPMSVHGHHEAMDVHEDVAEYDHGYATHDSKGQEIDPDTYIWQAKRAKQHFGKSADNTMDNPVTESSSLFAKLTEAYSAFLAEERENDAGILSPLSDPDIEDFDKDPMAGQPVVDDGSHSPMSTVKRQPLRK